MLEMMSVQRYYYIERTRLFRSDRSNQHRIFASEQRRHWVAANKKEGTILATQILDFLTAQTDKLVLVGMLALIVLSALQLAKMSRTNRQLKYLTEKLAGYLKAVLADEENEEYEEDESQEEAAFVSRQEQNMREAIEQQKQQKKAPPEDEQVALF